MSNTQIINELIMTVTGVTDFNYLDLPPHGDPAHYLWYEIKGTEWTFNVMPHEKSIVVYSHTKKFEWYITLDGPVLASVMEFPGVCQREFKLNNMSPDLSTFVWRSANVNWMFNDMPVEDCIALKLGRYLGVVQTGWFCKELPSLDQMAAQNDISEAIIPAALGRPLAPFENFQCNIGRRKDGTHTFSITLTYHDLPQSDTKYVTLKSSHDPDAVRDVVRKIVGVEI